MFYVALLALLAIFNYILFKKIINRRFAKKHDVYLGVKGECDALDRENNELKKENTDLERVSGEIITLYDITKDICKTLDEEKVYALFCERIHKYIDIDDCQFIKTGGDLVKYTGYNVLPITIHKQPIGFLVTKGLKDKDAEKYQILSQQFNLGIKRALLYSRVQQLTITDGLTKVFNHRHFMARLNEEIERSKKFQHSFSLLMIDIDRFKSHNDKYGHLVGDAILREVAKVIKDSMRQIDFMGRYGGEEFCVVLTETERDQAVFFAERIRQSVEARHIRAYDETVNVTISIGISAYPQDAQDSAKIIDRADKALYKAKDTGRNKVCLYHPR